MNHREAIKIVLEICKPKGNDINCGNCPHFNNCELQAEYGKQTAMEMLSSFVNPLNQ